MQLAEQIAVRDLLALGEACLLPDDDLTLATVLKGPLFNFTDDDLFALCWQRDGRLWPALRARAAEQPHWQAAFDELRALMNRADPVRSEEQTSDCQSLMRLSYAVFRL